MTYPLHAPLHHRLCHLAKRVAHDVIDPHEVRELAADLLAHGLDTPAIVVLATGPGGADHAETVAQMNDVLEELGYPPLEPEPWWLGPPMTTLWDSIARAAPGLAEQWDLSDTDYLVASDLARHLVARLTADRTDEQVRDALDVIEEQLDTATRLCELILSGVLESPYGAIERSTDVSYGDFEAMFGPETLRLGRLSTGRG